MHPPVVIAPPARAFARPLLLLLLMLLSLLLLLLGTLVRPAHLALIVLLPPALPLAQIRLVERRLLPRGGRSVMVISRG